VGIARVGRDRAAVFQAGQYAPLLARQDLVAVHSTLHDGVSQHGQRHRTRFSRHRSSPACTRALAPTLNLNTHLPLPACTLAARSLAQCRAGLEVPFAPKRQRVSLPLVHHLGAPRARLGQ
jgi:hypothetical protein